MLKFNRMLSTLVVTAIMLSGLSIGSTQTTIAQTKSSSSWENIFKDYDPPVPPTTGGGRGSGLCAIAPQPITTNIVVWSDRPLLVWRGTLSRIEIHPTGSKQVLWRQAQIEKQNSIRYAAEAALQPGQTYDWLLFEQFAEEKSSPVQRVTFRVMDAQERDHIKMQLQNLQEELKSKGASAEETAIYRAQYFAQQNLWSDVLQEAYSVQNPSVALAGIIQDLPTKLCSKASRPNPLPAQ